MSKATRSYLVFILFTLGVGALSGLLTRSGMQQFQALALKPPLTLPPVVFPIVWSLLYLLMGIGAARIFLLPASPARDQALRLYLFPLAVNFFWSILFFSFALYLAAFLWLLFLWALILMMVRDFCRLDRAAGLLQVPYLLWVTFAGYLNLGVWILNR